MDFSEEASKLEKEFKEERISKLETELKNKKFALGVNVGAAVAHAGVAAWMYCAAAEPSDNQAGVILCSTVATLNGILHFSRLKNALRSVARIRGIRNELYLLKHCKIEVVEVDLDAVSENEINAEDEREM